MASADRGSIDERRPAPAARRTCTACGFDSSFADTGITSNGRRLWRCGRCLTVMAVPMPDDPTLGAVYEQLLSNGTYVDHVRQHGAVRRGRRPHDWYRSRLLRWASRRTNGRRMLEVGLGSGAFARRAMDAGWDHQGIDVSSHAVDLARELGVRARVAEIGEPPEADGTVDLVVCWEVLEHLADVHRDLVSIRRQLRTGGLLLLSTPNFDRPGYERTLRRGISPAMVPPVHLHFWTAAALRTTLEAAGFAVVLARTRRLYPPWPPTRAGVARSIRLLAGRQPGPTLYLGARLPSD